MLLEPINNRSEKKMVRKYKKLMAKLHEGGIKPKKLSGVVECSGLEKTESSRSKTGKIRTSSPRIK